MGKTYTDVVEMVRDLVGDTDPGFVRDLEDRIERRKLVKEMQIQRTLSELSVGNIAGIMECSVQLIEEIEAGYDDEVSSDEIRKYLLACYHARFVPIKD